MDIIGADGRIYGRRNVFCRDSLTKLQASGFFRVRRYGLEWQADDLDDLRGRRFSGYSVTRDLYRFVKHVNAQEALVERIALRLVISERSR